MDTKLDAGFWRTAVQYAGRMEKKDIQKIVDKQWNAGLLQQLGVRPADVHNFSVRVLRATECVVEDPAECFSWSAQPPSLPSLDAMKEVLRNRDLAPQRVVAAFHQDVQRLNHIVTLEDLRSLLEDHVSENEADWTCQTVLRTFKEAPPHLPGVRCHEIDGDETALFYPLRAGLKSMDLAAGGAHAATPAHHAAAVAKTTTTTTATPPAPGPPPGAAAAAAPKPAATATVPAPHKLTSATIDTLCDDVTLLDLQRGADDDDGDLAGAATTTNDGGAPPLTVESHFFGTHGGPPSRLRGAGVAIADGDRAAVFQEATLLGRLTEANTTAEATRHAFLNTHEPFCMICVGVQGGGKSHTLASVLEGCLLPFQEHDIVRLRSPMCALVLHFDRSSHSMCEATGLTHPSATLRRLLGDQVAKQRCLPREKLVVLVSPTFYEQRKRFYAGFCEVRPLLFQWKSITADAIRRIMRVADDDTQLYMAALLDLLRQYQRQGKMPAFNDFVEEVKGLCNVKGQGGPLEQRLSLLGALIADSHVNQSLAAAAKGMDVRAACQPGTLCVVDLTDPMLSSPEANGIFTVLVEQFRSLPNTRAGKLLALDEAHKYMSGTPAIDGLAASLVNGARLMRHDGLRLVVSTQSPLCLAPELLELTSVAVMHRFHSRDWFSYLKAKLPLVESHWPRILALEPGEALVFASRHLVSDALCCGGGGGSRGVDAASAEAGEDGVTAGLSSHVFPLTVRPRITADRGTSRTNA